MSGGGQNIRGKVKNDPELQEQGIPALYQFVDDWIVGLCLGPPDGLLVLAEQLEQAGEVSSTAKGENTIRKDYASQHLFKGQSGQPKLGSGLSPRTPPEN